MAPSALIGLFVIVLISASFLIPIPRSARAEEPQGPCPVGTVPVTDRVVARAAGIPDSSPCWQPKNQNAGQDAGQAKEELGKMLCPPDGDNYGGKGPDGTIRDLDGKFAVCAAKFLKSARDNGTDVCIREGARTVEKQNSYVRRGVIACTKGAACEHPRGLAIDVNVRPNIKSCASYTNLHNAAPQFGLSFYLGCRDAYHFRPTSAGCNAGGVVPPPSDYDYPQFAPQQAVPSSQLFDAIRRMLGMQQQPPLPPQPPPPPQPSLPAQPTLPAQPSISSEGPQAAPVSSGITIDPIKTPGSTQTTPTSTKKATSTYDLIDAFANPVSDSIDIGTPVSIALNDTTLSSTTQLQDTVPLVRIASGTIAIIQGYAPQQTFTSGDLANNPVWGVVPPQNGALARLLITLRDTLLYALNYLRPFGGTAPR